MHRTIVVNVVRLSKADEQGATNGRLGGRRTRTRGRGSVRGLPGVYWLAAGKQNGNPGLEILSLSGG